MKQEYKEKIEEAKKLLVWNTNLPSDELDANVDKGCDLLDELVTIKDVDVLTELLEFFTDANEDYGGVCETLMNDIWNNYTADQIIEAISVKFDYLIKNDLSRFACLCNILFNQEDFVKFRKMFNKIKSNNSDKFLDELSKWIDSDYEVGLEGIALLREDVRKWK